MNHKQSVLAELESLYDPNFEVPPGLYIPVGSRVLVKEIKQGEHKIGSIIVPGASQLQHAKIGVVYRIGESVTLPIKIGMTVAYDKAAFMGILHNEVAYVDLMEHQIFSVVPPSNYLRPHVADTDEIRRQDRIDFTKRSKAITNQQIEALEK